MYIEQVWKGKTDFWRYLIGVILIVAGVFIAQIPYIIAIFMEAGLDLAKMTPAEQMAVLDSNLNLFLMLFGFLGGLLALFFSVRYIHSQKLLYLTTSRKKMDWGRVFFAFGMVVLFIGGMTLIDYFQHPDHYVWNFELVPFLWLCVVAIVMIPIQTSFEEYFFRGYLMQGIGVTFKNRWMPLVITSVIFGTMHFWNPEIDKLGSLVLVEYVAAGFLFGILTLMDDGLELSLGFHAGNNLVIALLVTTDWTAFQTNSLLKDVSEPSYGGTDMLLSLGFYAVILFVFSKKYKWSNWKDKLFGKVQPPIEETEFIEN